MFSASQLQQIVAGMLPPAAYKKITLNGAAGSGALSAAAAYTTVLTGTNNDLVYTADTAGEAGNDITIEYRDPGVSGGAIKCTMDDANSIVVILATSAGVKAGGVLTSDATNPSVDDTVTIGSTVYRFKSTMLAAYDVKIGAAAADTLDNLKHAINATGVAGTHYFAGTLIHPTITATTNTDTAQTVEAKTVGAAGNLIAKTESSSHLDWDGAGAVMTGGQDVGQIVSLASEVKTAVEASGVAAALVNITNSGADDATGVVTAMSTKTLTGGADGKIPLFTVHGECLVSLRAYVETAGAGAGSTLVHGKTGTTNDLITILTVTNITKGASIDSTGVVARGTAAAKTPLKLYHDGETIFATVATAAATGGVLHYLADFTPLSESAYVEAD